MSIIPITDFDDPQLDIYARRSEGQLLHFYEPKEGIFIAESPRVIQTAFDEGYEPISFLVEERHVKTQAKHILEQYPDIPAYTASYDVLKKLTGFVMARGMLCAMHRYKSYRYFGECYESNECRGNFSQCSSIKYGCHTAYERMF